VHAVDPHAVAPRAVRRGGGRSAGSLVVRGLVAALAFLCCLTGSAALTGCGADAGADGDPGREPAGASGWRLVWSDDFDRLDPAHWNVQDLASRRNEEWQYYSPDDVSVVDGRLRLTSRRDVSIGDRTFSSGAVDSYQRFSFTYGRVEIVAKLPAMGQGVWPALWMLETGCHPSGAPCPWPTRGAGEIDIMEAVNQPSPYYGNLHYGTEAGVSLSPGPIEFAAPQLSAGFHTFAVEWEAGGVVRWFLDGTQLAERSAPGHLDAPMYLFLNTALGGSWPGPVAESTPFPQRFEIDAVRVLQR
jgi:beta-glucanase (GH16 family)